ncbi:trypsin-like peptidase domain-containing protein [bacterium]|nr:trypsin-like peptidase domain-containing protein [bacterium]
MPGKTHSFWIGMSLCLASLALPSSRVRGDGTIDDRRALRRSPVVEVFEKTKNAVVNISTTQIIQVRSSMIFDSLFDEMFDFPTGAGPTRELKRTAVGSGFVIHPSGYIVTNAHVVARTAERKVIFPDKQEFDAEIVATDARRDLAVLKISADKPLDSINLGRSDDLMVGESVIAIGNPLGLDTTVTTGVVSALDRSLEVRGEVALDGLIQTDASINPGNSGGPLLNILGELIGITTAIRGDAQNIGFAIPVHRLMETLPELLSVERRYRIIVGLKVSPLGDRLVKEVRPGTPAAKAQIQPGDTIVSVNGMSLRHGIDYDIALVGHHAGETLLLEIDRQGKRYRIPLVSEPMPKPDGLTLARQKFGVEVEMLSANVVRKLELSSIRGMLITKIEKDGPAQRAGLEAGDILVDIGPFVPRSLDDLGLLLEDLPSGTPLTVSLLREGKRLIYRLRTQIIAR